MIGIGVVGFGYWGPNLVRNFWESERTKLVGLSDLRAARLRAAQSRYPSVAAVESYQELLRNSEIDAIAIATPVSSHYEIALECLRAGKHVLIEKPIAASVEQANILIEEAEKRGLVLMVDHTFVYTGAVRKIDELMSTGQLGEIFYYDSVRVNLGLFQHDVNVLWDLAVHDLSILSYLISAQPRAVSATGMSHVPGEPEDIAYLTLFFDNRLIAHIHVNWLAPVKVRRTLIGGSRKMIVYDDLEPSEKVKIYDKGITVSNGTDGIYKMLISYRTGDVLTPHLDITEALRIEIDHFADCIENHARPITDGVAGLKVLRLLEAAARSMRSGQVIELDGRKRVGDEVPLAKVAGIA